MKRTIRWKIATLVLSALLFAGFGSSQAQNLDVTGVVTEAGTGDALIGATVLQKGTTTGAVCDVNGRYKISVPKGATLVFSMIGYTTKEMVVEKAGTLDIALAVQVTSLDDVIVIGYSTQKKTDKTGAVSTVKSDDLNGGVITNPIQAMQGKAAGVLISKAGGDPSADFKVRIRGASGFESNTQPLYVIDGIPGADPNIVSPDDIESYNILKDAASTAIYGSRGSNGVIIITTKKGKSAGAKDGAREDGSFSNIEFSTQLSIERVAKKVDVLTADELRNHAGTLLTEAQLAHPNWTIDSIFIDGGANTDWQDQIYRTGVAYTNTLSFSGGNKNNSYIASVTNSNWQGTMKGTGKNQTTARIGVTQKAINDRLTLQGNLMGSFEKNDYENYNGWGPEDIIYQAISRNPTDPVYDSAGNYYQPSRIFNYENPMTVIEKITNNRQGRKFLGSLKGDFEILKGLVGSVNIGYTHDDATFNYFKPANIWTKADNGAGRKSYNANTQKLMEITGTYNKTLGKAHNVNALVGYSWQESVNSGFWAGGRDAQSNWAGPENLQVLNDMKAFGDVGSYKGKWTLIGFFGRAQYNFKSKYFISASLRRDGSSKFGANHKWGWFPTAAIGWSLDQEKFLRNTKWLSQLKLRASYGISGNQEIGEYRSLLLYTPSGKAINPETGKEVVTFSAAWNSNPDLKWEETTEYNVGLDFGFFNSRLSGSFEFYYKITDDLLGAYNVPVPPNLSRTTFANSGSMSNTGVELFLQAYPVSLKHFTWKTTLTASHNKTKVKSLGEFFNSTDGVRKEGYVSGRGMVGENNYVTGIIEGEEIGAFYLPTYVTIQNGVFIYESKNGGFTPDLKDAKRSIVATAAPKVELGWSNFLTYGKHWTLDFSFRAWIGNHVYNATRMLFDYPGNLPDLNAVPEAIDWYNKGRTQSPAIADIYVEDASFLKLDYISLSYDFNVRKISWLKKLALFVSANNVLTITGYSGVDPETTVNGLSFGIDQYNVYPKTRAYTAGLKVTF